MICRQGSPQISLLPQSQAHCPHTTPSSPEAPPSPLPSTTPPPPTAQPQTPTVKSPTKTTFQAILNITLMYTTQVTFLLPRMMLLNQYQLNIMSMVMVPSLLLLMPHIIRVPPSQRTQESGLNPRSPMSIILVRFGTCCVKGGLTFLSQAPYTPLTSPVGGTPDLSSPLSPTVCRLPGGEGDK